MVIELSDYRNFAVFPEKLRNVIELLLSKRARDIVIIDMRDFIHIAEFFILCTCDSGPHRKAVIDEFEERFGGQITLDFNPASGWNIVDFGDIIVHIFDEETRKFYDIEGLWTGMRQFHISEYA